MVAVKSRRFYDEPPVPTSSVASITLCSMKEFPMRTETDQLANSISGLVESLVETVASPEPDWTSVVDRFARIVSLHRHTGILRGKSASTMILWNTGFLLVRKMEASRTSQPALWQEAVKPLETLSEGIGIDPYKEFAALGAGGE